ncbi:hypothetical protein EDD15DRAFT_2155433, partial [Pisolithus albus]
MTRLGGAFAWSVTHNSNFKLSKFALVDFHYHSKNPHPPLTLRNATITPSRTHWFLGIIIDQSLCWNAHAAHALAKGTSYVMQIRRLSAANKGLPETLLHRLYLAVAVP